MSAAPTGTNARVEAAQLAIGRASQIAGLSDDPLAHVLAAQSAVLDAMQSAVVEFRGTGNPTISPAGERELIQITSNRVAFECKRAVEGLGGTLKGAAAWRAISIATVALILGIALGYFTRVGLPGSSVALCWEQAGTRVCGHATPDSSFR